MLNLLKEEIELINKILNVFQYWGMLVLFFSYFLMFSGQRWGDLKPGLLCWKHQELLVELKALGVGLIVLSPLSCVTAHTVPKHHIFLSFLLPYNNPKSSPSFTYKALGIGLIVLFLFSFLCYYSYSTLTPYISLFSFFLTMPSQVLPHTHQRPINFTYFLYQIAIKTH